MGTAIPSLLQAATHERHDMPEGAEAGLIKAHISSSLVNETERCTGQMRAHSPLAR